MTTTEPRACHRPTQRHAAPIGNVLHRAVAEYIEMPGLSLTAAQMQRLWSIGPADCNALVDVLVSAKLIRRCANGTYVRR
jgi:hypothetical protein